MWLASPHNLVASAGRGLAQRRVGEDGDFCDVPRSEGGRETRGHGERKASFFVDVGVNRRSTDGAGVVARGGDCLWEVIKVR